MTGTGSNINQERDEMLNKVPVPLEPSDSVVLVKSMEFLPLLFLSTETP
jgi:hypothetical protein